MTIDSKRHPGNLGSVLTSATSKTLTRSCIKVQNEARRLAKVDHGRLRASVTFRVTGATASQMKGRVGSNLDYALAVEEGTGIYGPRGRPIVPVRAQVLRFPVKGGRIVYARSVRGRPATPYLKPALQALRRAG